MFHRLHSLLMLAACSDPGAGTTSAAPGALDTSGGATESLGACHQEQYSTVELPPPVSEAEAIALLDSWNHHRLVWSSPESVAGMTESLQLSFDRGDGEAHTITSSRPASDGYAYCWGGTFLRMPVEATVSNFEGVANFSSSGLLDIASLSHVQDIAVYNFLADVELSGERLEMAQAQFEARKSEQAYWVGWQIDFVSSSMYSAESDIGDLDMVLLARHREEGAVSQGSMLLGQGQLAP